MILPQSATRTIWLAALCAMTLATPFVPGAAGAATSSPVSANTLAPHCAQSKPGVPIVAGKLAAQERAITAFVGTHFQSLGQCGPGLLALTLTPGSEALAKKVRTRFGPSLQIMVGLTIWNGRPGRSPRCGDLAVTSKAPPGYSAVLTLHSTKIRSGAAINGSVRFTDGSKENVRVVTGSPVEVVITKLGTRRIVGIFSGAIGGTAYSHVLSPHQSFSLGAIGGTARCDGGIGSALPPGRYDAVAEISGTAVNGTEETTAPTYDTRSVPIDVVAG